ncbi:MAG: hypothetical protein AAF403_07030 [Pseudomonadota bacterium]
MILLPTYKRPEKLKKFIDSAVKSLTSETIILGVNSDDDSYDHIDLPDFMLMMKVPPTNGAARVCQHIFNYFYDEPWYGILSDDVIIHTKHWDVLLAQAAQQQHVIYFKSRPEFEFRTDHFFLSGRFMRAIGGINFLDFNHYAADSYAKEVANFMFPRLVYTDDVYIEHVHPMFETAKVDKTYQRNDENKYYDAPKWNKIQNSAYMQQLLRAIKQRFAGSDIELPPVPKPYQQVTSIIEVDLKAIIRRG